MMCKWHYSITCKGISLIEADHVDTTEDVAARVAGNVSKSNVGLATDMGTLKESVGSTMPNIEASLEGVAMDIMALVEEPEARVDLTQLMLTTMKHMITIKRLTYLALMKVTAKV